MDMWTYKGIDVFRAGPVIHDGLRWYARTPDSWGEAPPLLRAQTRDGMRQMITAGRPAPATTMTETPMTRVPLDGRVRDEYGRPVTMVRAAVVAALVRARPRARPGRGDPDRHDSRLHVRHHHPR